MLEVLVATAILVPVRVATETSDLGAFSVQLLYWPLNLGGSYPHERGDTFSVVLSRTSLELLPMLTPNSPDTTVQACASTLQIENERGVSASVNACFSPGASCTFSKALSCFGGSPALRFKTQSQ